MNNTLNYRFKQALHEELSRLESRCFEQDVPSVPSMYAYRYASLYKKHTIKTQRAVSSFLGTVIKLFAHS